MTATVALAMLTFLKKSPPPTPATLEIKSWHEFAMKDIDGHDRKMSDYKGKTVLVVNVASKCGLTPQYEALEALYKKYKAKGFVIVGFPCNDFAGQEPGTEAEIKQFCTGKYDVTFPMYSKIHVKGPEQAQMYSWLVNKTGGKDVEWNFGKFLIDRHGQIIARFDPRTKPDDEKVIGAIEKALASHN